MRKTYHLCLSSHDEVMFRSEADLNMGFNALACAVLSTESRALAEGFLTTHHHLGVQTDNHKELFFRFRNAYARYFNTKYHRKGRLGERKYFSLEISGLHHTTTMLNYVIRQGLHHGLSATPFGYPHCSANAFFREALGKRNDPALIDAGKRHLYLPSNISVPPGYRMSASGLLLREDILDTAYVEEIYITPRNYLFQMNKLTDEKDLLEQHQALINEQGRVNHSRMTDLELCRVIDDTIVPRYCKGSGGLSIYDLPRIRRTEIGNALWQESRRSAGIRPRESGLPTGRNSFLAGKTVTESQLRRCLCLQYDVAE